MKRYRINNYTITVKDEEGVSEKELKQRAFSALKELVKSQKIKDSDKLVKLKENYNKTDYDFYNDLYNDVLFDTFNDMKLDIESAKNYHEGNDSVFIIFGNDNKTDYSKNIIDKLNEICKKYNITFKIKEVQGWCCGPTDIKAWKVYFNRDISKIEDSKETLKVSLFVEYDDDSGEQFYGKFDTAEHAAKIAEKDVAVKKYKIVGPDEEVIRNVVKKELVKDDDFEEELDNGQLSRTYANVIYYWDDINDFYDDGEQKTGELWDFVEYDTYKKMKEDFLKRIKNMKSFHGKEITRVDFDGFSDSPNEDAEKTEWFAVLDKDGNSIAEYSSLEEAKMFFNNDIRANSIMTTDGDKFIKLVESKQSTKDAKAKQVVYRQPNEKIIKTSFIVMGKDSDDEIKECDSLEEAVKVIKELPEEDKESDYYIEKAQEGKHVIFVNEIFDKEGKSL